MHVLNHGHTHLSVLTSSGVEADQKTGARHMILYLLALAQKVSSATFQNSAPAAISMKRDGVGEGGEREKGRKEGKKKAKKEEDHFSPKAFLLIHLAATVLSVTSDTLGCSSAPLCRLCHCTCLLHTN